MTENIQPPIDDIKIVQSQVERVVASLALEQDDDSEMLMLEGNFFINEVNPNSDPDRGNRFQALAIYAKDNPNTDAAAIFHALYGAEGGLSGILRSASPAETLKLHPIHFQNLSAEPILALGAYVVANKNSATVKGRDADGAIVIEKNLG